MIVVKTQIQSRQIIIRNPISKLSIISPLSKNENRAELVFKNKKYLYLSTVFSSQNYLKINKKQTKIPKSAHKLHSLHRSYNKL
jgi:hypothetical protein